MFSAAHEFPGVHELVGWIDCDEEFSAVTRERIQSLDFNLNCSQGPVGGK
jgi:hypothetical protein